MSDLSREDGYINKRNRESYGNIERNIDPIPKNILFEPINRCSHRCFFCGVKDMTRVKHMLEYELNCALLDQAYDMGVRSAGFYGCGEPLLVPDIHERIAYAVKRGYQYTYITTNGSVRDATVFGRLLDAGIRSIKFSINAGTAESYRKVHGRDDFDQVMQNIEYLANMIEQREGEKVLLSVSMVDSVYSGPETDMLRDRIKGFVNDFVIYGMNDQSGYRDNRDIRGEVPARKRAAPCPMVFNRIHVASNGYLSVCCEDMQQYLCVADLHVTPLAEAWGSQIFRNMRRRHLENSLEGTLCAYCITGSCEGLEPLVPQLCTPYDFSDVVSKRRDG